MRKGMAVLCGLGIMGGLLALTPLPRASAKAGSIDKELLGIRLLQSYKAVLQTYGQPTRIYRADEAVELIPATDANGRETGGIIAIGGSSQAGGFPGGGPGGMPGLGGGPVARPGGGMMGMPRKRRHDGNARWRHAWQRRHGQAAYGRQIGRRGRRRRGDARRRGNGRGLCHFR